MSTNDFQLQSETTKNTQAANQPMYSSPEIVDNQIGSKSLAFKRLDSWLSESDLPIKRVESNRWIVQMSHQYCTYLVNVVDHGEWTSFAAILFGAASGSNSDKFYRFILELNSDLNPAHIAIDGEKIVLVSNAVSEDSSQYRLYRDLSYFHKTHELAYEKLLCLAEDLKVRLEPC